MQCGPTFCSGTHYTLHGTHYRDQHASHVSWSGRGMREGENILEQHTASPHELIIAHFHSRKYAPPPRSLPPFNFRHPNLQHYKNRKNLNAPKASLVYTYHNRQGERRFLEFLRQFLFLFYILLVENKDSR